MYDNSSISESLSREILCETLQFLQRKIRDNDLSMSDVEALQHLFDGIDIAGTAQDFARFYGQSPVNVRSVICRKYIGKPRRAVLYSFRKFRTLIPSSWVAARCKDRAENQQGNETQG